MPRQPLSSQVRSTFPFRRAAKPPNPREKPGLIRPWLADLGLWRLVLSVSGRALAARLSCQVGRSSACPAGFLLVVGTVSAGQPRASLCTRLIGVIRSRAQGECRASRRWRPPWTIRPTTAKIRSRSRLGFQRRAGRSRADPAAADRWTWLIIACQAHLRLARLLAADLRRPWERSAPPGRLTPALVRRGFRNIRTKVRCPAGAPKPGKPDPSRPPGSKNCHPAQHHNVGKTTKRELTLKARHERAGLGGPGHLSPGLPQIPYVTVSCHTAFLTFSSRTASPTPSA